MRARARARAGAAQARQRPRAAVWAASTAKTRRARQLPQRGTTKGYQERLSTEKVVDEKVEGVTRGEALSRRQ